MQRSTTKHWAKLKEFFVEVDEEFPFEEMGMIV